MKFQVGMSSHRGYFEGRQLWNLLVPLKQDRLNFQTFQPVAKFATDLCKDSKIKSLSVTCCPTIIIQNTREKTPRKFTKTKILTYAYPVYRPKNEQGPKALWFNGDNWIYGNYNDLVKRGRPDRGFMVSTDFAAPCPELIPSKKWREYIRRKRSWVTDSGATIRCPEK